MLVGRLFSFWDGPFSGDIWYYFRGGNTVNWWKKSCTTWNVQSLENNGIIYLSTGAGFFPSTVGDKVINPIPSGLCTHYWKMHPTFIFLLKNGPLKSGDILLFRGGVNLSALAGPLQVMPLQIACEQAVCLGHLRGPGSSLVYTSCERAFSVRMK